MITERIGEERRKHLGRLRMVLHEECEIGTNLRELRSYEPRIYTMRGRTRDRLKDRLAQLTKERRRLDIENGRVMAELHDRLSLLLSRDDLLGTGG